MSFLLCRCRPFEDGLALVVMIAAALSFAVAVYKGWGGFSDPLPGYSHYSGRQLTGMDDDARDIAHGAQSRIDDIVDEAEEDILDLLTDGDQDLYEDVLAFNAEVHNAKDSMRVFAQAEAGRQDFVTGKSTPRDALNIDAFDGLLIWLDGLQNEPVQTSLLHELRETHTEASSRINAAYAGYMAAVNQFRVSPPTR